MIRFYLDEHISQVVAEILRREGVDAVTVQERSREGRTDGEQLRYAAGEGRCLVTENRTDFIRLSRRFQHLALPHAGVALVPPSLPTSGFRALAAALLQLAAEYPDGLAPYAVVWLKRVTKE